MSQDSSLIVLTSHDHLKEILKASPDKVTVIDFHATWCGPCHAIAPIYEQLSKNVKGINFLKCDVDEVGDVTEHYQIAAMPTFIFLKDGKQVDMIRGADKLRLQNTVAKYAEDIMESEENMDGEEEDSEDEGR